MGKSWKQNLFHNTQPNLLFPNLMDYEKKNQVLEKFEYRRMRILLRGMKLSGKKGGAGSGMAVFEMKGAKADKFKAAEEEERVKAEEAAGVEEGVKPDPAVE